LQQGFEIFQVWHLFGNSTTHWGIWYVGPNVQSHEGPYKDARRCWKAIQRSA
jgi:hypothetical protein